MSKPQAEGRAARLLVVEDNRLQAEALRSVLRSAGFSVEVAFSGEEALEWFGRETFDLVVTDILLPGMSGYDLCRAIKDGAAGPRPADLPAAVPQVRAPLSHEGALPAAGRAPLNVPVILLTALNEPLDILRGLQSGADNFITKPFEPDYLIGRIRNFLDNQALRAEGKLRIGVEVWFLGHKVTLSPDRTQILDLLVSTFEGILQANRELQKREQELAEARARADDYARRLEDRVRSTEGMYHRLMEQANDAILLLSPGGEVLEANRRAAELLGRRAADLVGTPFVDLVHPGEREAARQDLEQLRAAGAVRADGRCLVAAGGREVRVDFSASLVDVGAARVEGGGGRGEGKENPPPAPVVLAIAHDVTARMHLEEQLRGAQKLEAIGRLAGGVAHDFNNLLTIITASSDILLSRTDDERTRDLLREIQRAGDRAAGLTRQLLMFSRKQVTEPRILDLNVVVADTERMLRRLIGEDVSLTTVLNPRLGRIKADAGQIEQVLMNLAVNARDAMPRGGKLSITTADVGLDEDHARAHPEVRPGPYVMLAVRDTGVGMDEATKTRLFEPFFTTKGPGKGTGLGLATVYGIIKGAGGHVEVESEPGHGTTFKVYLPRREEEALANRPSHQGLSRAPVGHETILLAEDEDAVRAITRHVLQMCGYVVLEADTGEEAIRVASEYSGPIDLLLTDVVMPGMGGRELAEHLTAARPDVRVLYLSGYTDDAIVRHGVLEAETAFLQKPFTPTILAQKVREVLDSERH
jgi:PAS domain S-box-containing protein